MKVKILIFYVMILIFVNSVFALGITPGRTTLNFEPNLEKEIPFSVLNSENKDMAVVFYIQGELNQSITLKESYTEFTSGEESKQFSYIVKLPAEIKTPGLHQAEVVAMEMPKDFKEGKTLVGSTVAVTTQLNLNVPYPGKYLELDPGIVNAQEDGTVIFLISATNRGDLDIGKAKAVIDIYTSNGEKVAIIETDEREIISKQRVELIGKWSEGVQSGDYKAVISVIYDGENINAEKEFKVGEKVLEIQRIEVNNFKLGEIAKFNALIENKWSKPMEDVYLNLIVYNEKDEVMADIKSQTYELNSLEKVNMIAYWDTVGVKKGAYDGKLFLKYKDGSIDRDVTIRVSDNEILVMGISGEVVIEKLKQSNFQKILIISVVVLGALNLMWFIVLRRFIKKKK